MLISLEDICNKISGWEGDLAPLICEKNESAEILTLVFTLLPPATIAACRV
jgi:hypothetical protein